MGAFQPQQYLRPDSLHEASAILSRYKESARVIGGGTEIYELASRGFLSDVRVLVDLGKLGLDKVKKNNNGSLSIGASVTLSQLECEKEIRKNAMFACISDALFDIRPVQVKNIATIGGAVCSAIPFFDLPVALGCLGSVVEVNGPKGTRRVPILDFQRDFLQPDLNWGEFVKNVIVSNGQAPDADNERIRQSAFSKFAITGDDWAIVNCACYLELDSEVIEKASIVFGAVSNKLFFAEQTANGIRGMKAGKELTSKAVEVLDKELLEPISDSRASSKYRKRIAKILLAETLEKALLRQSGEVNNS
jgi:CO/xanthine dehydrogenase FAD-binding subunit